VRAARFGLVGCVRPATGMEHRNTEAFLTRARRSPTSIEALAAAVVNRCSASTEGDRLRYPLPALAIISLAVFGRCTRMAGPAVAAKSLVHRATRRARVAVPTSRLAPPVPIRDTRQDLTNIEEKVEDLVSTQFKRP
jgi:hypothetical protein